MATPTCRVKAVTVYCTDRHRSGDFYEEALGAVPDRRDHDYCRWYTLGSTPITLVPNAADPSPPRLPDHAMASLSLEVDDLPAAVAHFARLGVEVRQRSDGQVILIADPDGLPLEVGQADDGPR